MWRMTAKVSLCETGAAAGQSALRAFEYLDMPPDRAQQVRGEQSAERPPIMIARRWFM